MKKIFIKGLMLDYLLNKDIDLKDTKKLYINLDCLYRFTCGNPSYNCLSKEFKEYCLSVDFEEFLKDFEEMRKEAIKILDEE